MIRCNSISLLVRFSDLKTLEYSVSEEYLSLEICCDIVLRVLISRYTSEHFDHAIREGNSPHWL